VQQTAVTVSPRSWGSWGSPWFAHDGPRIDTPPPAVGQHNEEIFAELGLAQRQGGGTAAVDHDRN
jgi:hypothetical protein